MPLTNFIPRQTLITAKWLNEVDRHITLSGNTSPYIVDSIMNVNSLQLNLVYNSIIYARGRETPGDGGGGFFTYRTDISPAVDNGLIFAPVNNVGVFIRFGWTEDGFDGIINTSWFGVIPGTDCTVAMSRVKNTVVSLGGGKVHHNLPGDYIISSQILWTTGYITMSWHPQARLLTNFASSSTEAAYRFEASNPTKYTTTVTANITLAASSISVPDLSLFSIGDLLSISNGEYFNGVTSVPGFGVQTKGELVRVLFKAASTGAGLIYLSNKTQDSYDNTTYPVVLRGLNELKNITIKDGNFHGQGGGTTHGASPPTGARAFNFQVCTNLKVTKNKFDNFPRFACQANWCETLDIQDNTFDGRDLTDVTNASITPSIWFTGFYVTACVDVKFIGNTGKFLRRHIDVDGGTTVPRGIVIAGNTAISCGFVVGTHICQGASITGNVGVGCDAGIVFRGKDAVITGNNVGQLNRYHIKLGGMSSEAMTYTQTPSVGNVTLQGNVGVGGTNWLLLTVDCDSLTINGGNSAVNLTGDAIRIFGRRLNKISITGSNTFDGSARGVTSSALLKILAPNAGSLLALNGLTVEGVESSFFYDGVALGGCSDPATLAEDIYINDNKFKNHERSSIRIATNTGTDIVTGWFGYRCQLLRNEVSGSTPETIGQSRFAQLPLTDNFSATQVVGPVYKSAAAADPALGTILQGQYIINTTSTPGNYARRRCNVPGTFGTIAARTGTINSGSPTLVMNNVAGVFIGAYLNITGAGVAAATLKARVINISLGTLTVTLDTNASTSVVAQTVQLAPPTMVSEGLIV